MSESPFKALLQQGVLAYSRRDATAAKKALDEAAALAATTNELGQVAMLHRRFGRFEESVRILRRIVTKEPELPDTYLQLALVDATTPDDVDRMVSLHGATTDGETRIKLGFALGKIFQDAGDYEKSYAYYEGANRAQRSTLTYSIDDDAAELTAIISTFTEKTFVAPRPAGDATSQPIFIVGMPRSGSSLIEQILASHRSVLGGGEMNLMGRVQNTMEHEAGSLASFVAGRPDLRPWAAAYLEPVLAALKQSRKSRFTDKQLLNFKRIGLIKLMFPDARIVHCVRNPLDHLFTIWRRPFGDDKIGYAYDQRELGAYYRLYTAVMEHWDRVLPGFVFHQRYEDIVADPEASMRALLAYCNLDWDPAVIEFHRTERGVTTNSFAQVRKPLYGDSVGLAEPYRHHLGPLIEAAGL
jgi:tetratricopeptide (TPR) repeat protein